MKDSKHIFELEFIKDWVLTILDVLDKFYPEGKQDDFREIVINAFKRHNLRGLRYVYSDANEMAGYMSREQIEYLNAILKDKFGFDLNDKNKKDLVKIKVILSRGCIKNASEYRLLSNRVEQIYADEDKVDELEALNRLLLDFDSKHEPVND